MILARVFAVVRRNETIWRKVPSLCAAHICGQLDIASARLTTLLSFASHILNHPSASREILLSEEEKAKHDVGFYRLLFLPHN